ncbi:unnamed protein product [Musa acuminata var. zebrina]
MSMAKGSKMLQRRTMNLVLGDCEEFRNLPPVKGAAAARGKKPGEEREDRRILGLVLLRCKEVVSMTVEGPPPPDESRAKAHAAAALAGPGISTAPLVQAQPGLAGPASAGPHPG